MPGSGVRIAIHELGVCVMVVHLPSMCKALGSIYPQHHMHNRIPKEIICPIFPSGNVQQNCNISQQGYCYLQNLSLYPDFSSLLPGIIEICVCVHFYMLTPIQFHHLCMLRYLSPQTRQLNSPQIKRISCDEQSDINTSTDSSLQFLKGGKPRVLTHLDRASLIVVAFALKRRKKKRRKGYDLLIYFYCSNSQPWLLP